MKIIIALTVAVALTGCAGTTNIVSTGPGTYMAASHGVMGWSSGPAQKAKAFQDAGAYCGNIGRQLEPIRSSEVPSGFGKIASGEVEFRCIK